MSASETTNDVKPPPARHTIQLPGQEKGTEVFMSFGLLNELTPLVGGPERIAEFDFDPVLREHTIRLCVAPRDDRQKIDENYQLPPGLELDEAEKLLDWVKGHVLNFFIRRLTKNIEMFETNTEALRLMAKLPQARTG